MREVQHCTGVYSPLLFQAPLRFASAATTHHRRYFFIVDRLKELIKVKGFQVAPAELEALLLTHPHVADAAVLGVPDERAGEAVRAYVVLKPDVAAAASGSGDATTTEATIDAAIKEFVAEKVADYKQISQIVFTEAIPKSPAGKILRRLLRSD